MTAELQMEINEQREKLRLEQIEREALMHEVNIITYLDLFSLAF